MLPLDHPDRIQITFDDRRLVANAGLLLPVTLAQHLGLRELVTITGVGVRVCAGTGVLVARPPGRAGRGRCNIACVDQYVWVIARNQHFGECSVLWLSHREVPGADLDVGPVDGVLTPIGFGPSPPTAPLVSTLDGAHRSGPRAPFDRLAPLAGKPSYGDEVVGVVQMVGVDACRPPPTPPSLRAAGQIQAPLWWALPNGTMWSTSNFPGSVTTVLV